MSERVAAVERLGVEQVWELRRLVWSEREPDRLRIAAWDRLLAVDAEVWPVAERRLAVVRSVAVMDAVCGSLPEAERARMTPVLLRSLARRSRGGLAVADDERPEWIGLGWDTTEQRRAGLRGWVTREGGSGGKASESAWVVLCRWDGVERQRAWLESLPLGAHAEVRLIAKLVWSAAHLSRLPQSREELRWLASVWPRVLVETSSLVQHEDLAVRHLPMFAGAWAERPFPTAGLVPVHVMRAGEEQIAGLDQAYGRQLVTPSDDRLLRLIAGVLSAPATRAVLFEQADRDVLDLSSEYGGLLEMPDEDGGSAAVPIAPLVRRDDQRYIPSPRLFDRLLTARGIAYYHFHAQSYDRRAFAGPGLGDLRVAAQLGVTCVVLTFLDRDTLNVDVILPGVTAETMPTIVDLGSIQRPE
ncbi:MAG: hypothetical protein AAF797_03640 [Planctomycetota bacterium]